MHTSQTHYYITYRSNPIYSNSKLSIKHYYKLLQTQIIQKKPASLTRSTITPSSRAGLGILATNWFLFNWKEYKQYRTNELTSSASHNDKTENNDHQVNMVMTSSEQ